MKIAIIGAGAAGLASLRYSLDEGHECVVFEQTGNVGGTWNYVEKVGLDEYGLPIHSSMYKGLRYFQYSSFIFSLLNMKIAIIGAGAAGLASLKYSLEEGHECTVFEQTGNVGGTWNYVETVGIDEYGLPIHSSMYEGLRTNLPKELMEYEDFPYKEQDISYIPQEEVLTYMNNYAVFFNLLPHIKFFKHVLETDPLPEGKWLIKVRDLKTNNIEHKEYDSVFICVGHYSVPNVPEIQGINKFKGNVIHSHDYRKPDLFRNSKVLVIGAGPSGLDISYIISKVVEKVLISIRPSEDRWIPDLPENVFIQTEIQEFGENYVIFKDNTQENIDDVIFCTGYRHSYPFLTSKCGIQVENNWVKYLYKQIVNIEHPTMGFIGVPFHVSLFALFCIQARFFLSFLKGNIKVSKEQMLQDLIEYVSKLKEDKPSHHPHLLGPKQGCLYMDDLADTADIKKIPPVICRLYDYVVTHARGKFDISYKIVNDNEYIVKDS